jgi:diacylglycerol O-acyltransferase
MRRLTGDSAGFLYLESPRQSAHVVYLALLRTDGPALTLPDIRRHVEDRLAVLPSFRWRVERVPLGLHHSVYIDDPDFDLDFHLRQHTLPAPGGPAEIDAFMGRLAERFLDRRHPLWQIMLLDGLPGGRQALAIRFHHAILDGGGARTTLSRLLDDRIAAEAGPEPVWSPERPSRSRLLVDALVDQAHQMPDIRPLITDSRAGLAAAKAVDEGLEAKVPVVFKDTPVVPFNRARSNNRRYARLELPLADFLTVKNAARVSVNDVALAVVGAAMRSYLERDGLLPDKSLTANVPVAAEPPGAPPRQWGNRFSNLITTLGTDEPDPWRRLMTIRDVTRGARQRLDALGVDLAARWLELTPAFFGEWFNRQLARARSRMADRAEANVLLSNVRLSDRPWRFGSTDVELVCLSGPPSDGNGVNVTLTTYGDRVTFVVLCNPDVLPDPIELLDGLRDGLAELVELSATHGDRDGASRLAGAVT